MAPAPKKFTQTCKAYKFLKAGMEKRDIDSNEMPKGIYDSYPEVFDGYTLGQVRTGFNKIKALLGSHVRDGGKCFFSLKLGFVMQEILLTTLLSKMRSRMMMVLAVVMRKSIARGQTAYHQERAVARRNPAKMVSFP